MLKMLEWGDLHLEGQLLSGFDIGIIIVIIIFSAVIAWRPFSPEVGGLIGALR